MAKLAVASALFAAVLSAQDVGVGFTNGVDAFLEHPYSPLLVPATGITVEAWLTYDDNIPTGTSIYPTIVRQNVASGQESYFLRVNAGTTGARTLRWKVVTTGGFQIFCDWSFSAGQLATWTHVAATFDGSTSALYVDGVLVATATSPNQPLRDLGGVFRVGKGDDASGPTEVWNGQLDEVRVWPVARTAAEIQATLQQKLFVVPGNVVSWTMDDMLVDISSQLTLNALGTVPFVNNTQTYAVPTTPAAIGTSTPGCLGAIRLTPTSVAAAGNQAFATVCHRLPPGAALVWCATLGTLPTPIPVLGVDIWLDPTVLVTIGGTASARGVAKLPFPMPASAAGFHFALQALALDPCGSQGFTASDALDVVVQP